MSNAAVPGGFDGEVEPQLLAFVAGSRPASPGSTQVASLVHGASASLAETELGAALQALLDSTVQLVDAEGATLVLVDGSDPLILRAERGGAGEDASRLVVAPLAFGGETTGRLRVGPRRTGGFSADDRRVVESLALAMTLAVRNARLIAEVGAHEVLLDSTARLFAAVVEVPAAHAVDALLTQIATRVEPDQVCAVVRGPHSGSIRIVACRGGGPHPAPAPGDEPFDAAGSLADLVLTDGTTRAIAESDAATAEPGTVVIDGRAGPLLVVRLGTRTDPDLTVLVGRRPGDHAFTEMEMRAADRLASLVAAALDSSRARDAEYRATAREDRAAIARDLHDHVIQQLYAASLDLAGLAGRAPTDDVQVLIDRNVLLIDSGIDRIRAIMSAVTARSESDATHSIRHFVHELTQSISSLLPQPIGVELSGAIDVVVVGGLYDEVTAVLRELLMNAVRHASAQSVRVSVRVDVTTPTGGARTSALVVRVSDDGVGLPADVTRSGLANLDERARRRAGSFTVHSSEGRTDAEWRVPILSTSAGSATPIIGAPQPSGEGAAP